MEALEQPVLPAALQFLRQLSPRQKLKICLAFMLISLLAWQLWKQGRSLRLRLSIRRRGNVLDASKLFSKGNSTEVLPNTIGKSLSKNSLPKSSEQPDPLPPPPDFSGPDSIAVSAAMFSPGSVVKDESGVEFLLPSAVSGSPQTLEAIGQEVELQGIRLSALETEIIKRRKIQ